MTTMSGPSNMIHMTVTTVYYAATIIVMVRSPTWLRLAKDCVVVKRNHYFLLFEV